MKLLQGFLELLVLTLGLKLGCLTESINIFLANVCNRLGIFMHIF